MTNQKILITGASGYVGAMIYKYLKDTGLDVIGTYFSKKLFDDLVYCDITNQQEVARLFEEHNPSVVLHIAANASNGSCDENPEAANKLNVDATKYLVEEARSHNSKFIFLSSFAAYNPTDVYGKSKVSAENLVESLNEYIILRPSLIIGMSPNSNNDRPFNRFVRNVLDKSTEVEYDSSWEFNVTFLSHLAAVCLNIIKEEKYKKIIVSVVSRQVTSRYKLGKDILSSFGITVKPIDKNAKTNEPEIDWNIYSQLNLPTMEYPEGIAEIIKDLQTIGF